MIYLVISSVILYFILQKFQKNFQKRNGDSESEFIEFLRKRVLNLTLYFSGIRISPCFSIDAYNLYFNPIRIPQNSILNGMIKINESRELVGEISVSYKLFNFTRTYNFGKIQRYISKRRENIATFFSVEIYLRKK